MSFEEFPFDASMSKPPTGPTRRWYDETFVRPYIDSMLEVPPYKRESYAQRILDVVESVFKNEINRKVNTNKYMILGMYKEFEKRRWYDRNPVIHKSIKSMCSLVDQRQDLQKVAQAGIADILGEYMLQEEEPEVEIRQPDPIMEEPEPIPEPMPEAEPEPEPEEDDEEKKKRDAKLMVSGEKLFIKREKNPKLRKKKKKPKI